MNLQLTLGHFQPWLAEVKSRAEREENLLAPGENPKAWQRYKYRGTGDTSAVMLTYSQDALPDGGTARHLSCQFSIDGMATEADVRGALPQLHRVFEAVVREAWPFHDQVGTSLVVERPRPVADPATRHAVMRTPVIVHYVVTGDAQARINGRRSPLLDAQGRPARAAANLATPGRLTRS